VSSSLSIRFIRGVLLISCASERAFLTLQPLHTFVNEMRTLTHYPEFGAISPCEMNEFSEECEAWEAENGPYEKGEYMVKSNSRTKGR
jgi:hypothetical protein